MGYDYGYLLGHAINESYHNLLANTVPKLVENYVVQSLTIVVGTKSH